MDFGLLILRVAVGALFIAHGTQKLFGWFGGHGIEGTGGFLETLHYRPGRLMAAALGLSEAGGGLLLVLGFLTPLGAAAVMGVMIPAIISVKLDKGLFGGYELELLYAIAGLALAFAGPGVYSVDYALGLTLHGFAWGFGAAALAAFSASTVLLGRRVPVVHAAALSGQERRTA